MPCFQFVRHSAGLARAFMVGGEFILDSCFCYANGFSLTNPFVLLSAGFARAIWWEINSSLEFGLQVFC